MFASRRPATGLFRRHPARLRFNPPSPIANPRIWPNRPRHRAGEPCYVHRVGPFPTVVPQRRDRPRLQRVRAGQAQPAGSPFATLTQVAEGVQPTPAQLLQLQQTVGNGAVQRLVGRQSGPRVQRCGDDEACACAGCSSKQAAQKGAQRDETLQRATGDGHDLSAAPIAGDPQLEDAFDGAKTKYVRQGAKGETVRKLQNALLWLGETLPNYGPDGDYGGETRSAVVHFQRARRLATTAWSAPRR